MRMTEERTKISLPRAAQAAASRPPRAAILLVGDDAERLDGLEFSLRRAGHQPVRAADADAALAQLAAQRFALVVSDAARADRCGFALFEDICRSLPAVAMILIARDACIADAVDATARGIFRYLADPVDFGALHEAIDSALALLGPAGAAAGPVAEWRAEIISHSSLMETVIEEAWLVAASDASVLIRGESGTGKEILARAIHRASRRAQAPFVAINCGAIPEPLLESELFGHARGAFTGAAKAHTGLLQTAHGGTVFLDEIGDMPLALQVKLLRVLQERAVRPVGANRAAPIDVRIISATHRDLDRATAGGAFREDLYYRLNVVSLTLPTLDARREDIPLLANHFLQSLARKYHKRVRGFAPEALQALARASWPGNVRQLQNVVEQACALATTPLIPLALIERSLRGARPATLNYAEARLRFERDYLVQLLKLTDGNVSDAARLAGRNRTEFYRLLQRHALSPGFFRHGRFALRGGIG